MGGFWAMVLGEPDTHVQENGIGPNLTPSTEMNSGWSKALKVRAGTMEPLEESTEEKLRDIELGSGFLDVMPKIQATKEKNS